MSGEIVSTNTREEHVNAILPVLEGVIRELGNLFQHLGSIAGNGSSHDSEECEGNEERKVEVVAEEVTSCRRVPKKSREMPIIFPRIESYEVMGHPKNRGN